MSLFRFSISATFTADPVGPILAFWSQQLGIETEVEFAPYNQLVQTLLDPQGPFVRNTSGVNVVLARLENLASFKGTEETEHLAETNVRDLLEVLRQASGQLTCPTIFCLCPSSAAHFSASFEKRIAAWIECSLEGVPQVRFLHHQQIERLYPAGNPFDAEAERLARIPYTELWFAALGTALVRETVSRFSNPYKVIALDCDNTLWRGICGEDGPSGVSLDGSALALQHFMIEQREAGMLLCLASKNNPEDVAETFRLHPSMPLQMRHFAASRLNWEPKAENLQSLAGELNLGLDSFIFVDDNPKECAEVREGAPEVLTLTLPDDPGRTSHFLHHVWAFDHPAVTEEDRNRNTYYSQARAFGHEVEKAHSLEHFMASLNLSVRIGPAGAATYPRAAQLTQRTNQLNFTTVRRSETEIRALAHQDATEVLTIDVSDRFGDYGVVGLMITGLAADTLVIDTFLLSCRALGRGVEHQMMRHLGQKATALGLARVHAALGVTLKNMPARQFLDSICGGHRLATSTGFVYDFPAAMLRNLEWKPVHRPLEDDTSLRPAKPQSRAGRAVDFGRIASELSRPSEILDAVRAGRREFAASNMSRGNMTELERDLAAIWSEILGRPCSSVSDNFFDMGGHSLLAVLLLLRVREQFEVDLSMDDVYSGTLTLGRLAEKIESVQLGQLTPEEYEAMLSEIQDLPEDEVLRLLAEEQHSGKA